MIFYNKKRLLTIFAILSAFIGLGQSIQRFEGMKQIGPYYGNARYDYFILNTDTVYNGDFLIKKSNLATLLEKEDASFSFRGKFTKGIPTGKWNFEFGNYQSNSKSTLVDYEYRVLISGRQEVGGGILQNGTPNDRWTYSVNNIQDSEVAQNLFKSTVFFNNGVPQKNFQIAHNNSVLIGRFLRDGLAHDEWSAYASNDVEDTESWFFTEGILKKIQLSTARTTKELQVFNKNVKAYKTITLDSTYLKVIAATVFVNGFAQDQTSPVNKLLLENNAYYQKMNAVVNAVGDAQIRPNFKVKVPFYGLNAQEKAKLASIMKNYEAAKKLSKTILTNGHLNIIKRTDSEILYQYNTVQKITAHFIHPLQKLITYQKDGILDYIDTNSLMTQLWIDGKPATKINVAIDSLNTTRIFELPNANEFNFEEDTLEATAQIAAYAKTSLEQINTKLLNQLRSEDDLETLNLLEEALISMNTDLVVEKDSNTNKLSAKHKKALQKLKTLSDHLLSDYAQIQKTDEKLIFGHQLKDCFEKLLLLKQTLLALPEKQDTIQKLYMDAVWNPFMALVMEEEVKKRITAPYFNTLVPYFLDGITTELNCDNIEDWTHQITYTNDRMVVLRNKDTQKLERKLRKEKRPKEILKLLFQQSNAKEQ